MVIWLSRAPREADVRSEWMAEIALFHSVLDYPGAGHLFTDASLPDEYDPSAAELL